MKKFDAAFLFYPRDWTLDTRVRGMSFEERGVYLEMLCIAWIDGGIPADLETLRAVLRMTKAKFAKVWAKVGPCWELRDGVLVNRRQEHERSERQRKGEEMARRGAVGNQKRWSADEADESQTNRISFASKVAQTSHEPSQNDRRGVAEAIAQASPLTLTLTSTEPEKASKQGVSLSQEESTRGIPYRDPGAIVNGLAEAKAVRS